MAINTQIIRDFCFLPVFWILRFLPKDRSIWLFGAWAGEGFKDNPRWLFEYSAKNGLSSSIYWVSKHPTELNNIPKNYHKHVIFRGTLKWLFLTARAGSVFYTHSPKSDIGYASNTHRTIKYQLWHGCPIKKIGSDDTKNNSVSDRKIIKSIVNFIMPYRMELHDRAFAMSTYDKDIFERIFRPKLGTVITGYPRQDVSLTKGDKKLNTNNEVKILYAPTFRALGQAQLVDFGLSEESLHMSNEYLKNLNVVLHIKLHPVTKLSSVESSALHLSNIQFLLNDFDVSEEICSYDMLITDYSSLCFDFLAQAKPTAFFHHDKDAYENNNRNFYESMITDLWGPIFSKWTDVLSYLKHFCVDKSIEDRSIEIAQSRFCEANNNKICRRIFQIASEDANNI